MGDTTVEGLLTEILRWIKFSGAKEVRGILESTLDTDQKRRIYHLSDGDKGSIEIARLSQTSDSTVRRHWASWARLGIVESLRVRGGERYRKSFDLNDFGIQMPESSTEIEPTVIAEQSVPPVVAEGDDKNG